MTPSLASTCDCPRSKESLETVFFPSGPRKVHSKNFPEAWEEESRVAFLYGLWLGSAVWERRFFLVDSNCLLSWLHSLHSVRTVCSILCLWTLTLPNKALCTLPLEAGLRWSQQQQSLVSLWCRVPYTVYIFLNIPSLKKWLPRKCLVDFSLS